MPGEFKSKNGPAIIQSVVRNKRNNAKEAKDVLQLLADFLNMQHIRVEQDQQLNKLVIRIDPPSDQALKQLEAQLAALAPGGL